MRSGFPGTVEELNGKTLGVIGYGSIGRETARLAQAFGMRILALKRDPGQSARRRMVSGGAGRSGGLQFPRSFSDPSTARSCCAESDYMTVTLPGTKHTRKFIGAREIAAMRPGAYIVNIGRGEVIDETRAHRSA